MKKLLFILLLCGGICACSTDKKIAPKDGRLSLQVENTIPPTKNAMQLSHMLVIQPTENWENDEGSGTKTMPLPVPVLDKKAVYALDGEFVLRAHHRDSGEILWENVLSTHEDIGFALVHHEKNLLAVSAKGQLAFVDTTGKTLWIKDMKAPIRSQPQLDSDFIYLLSANNDLWVLRKTDGTEVWHYKSEAPMTFLWQMGGVALSKSFVIAPLSSGTVMALDKKTGSYIWSQEMIGPQSFNQINNMAQMTANPVIDGTSVYLVGNAGLTGAFRLKDGQEIWTRPYGGQITPIIRDNAFFMLTSEQVLLALDKNHGQLFWQQSLPQIKDIKGLYLVDGQIIVLGREKALLLNAKTGEIQEFKDIDLNGATPIVANDGWYYMTPEGRLVHQGKI